MVTIREKPVYQRGWMIDSQRVLAVLARDGSISKGMDD